MCDCGAADCVTDAANGDVVCRQCGVVMEAHIFDEHLEYYSDRAGPRAGPPEPWLLPLPPVVLDHIPHHQRPMANTDPHTSTRELFGVVQSMGHKFSTDVQDTAKLLCRDLSACKVVRSDTRHLHAACALYLASKMHGAGIGRSKKEIAADFADVGVTERALTATAKVFKDALQRAPYACRLLQGLDAADLINRSVDRLRVDPKQRRAVKRLAHDLADRVPAQETEGKTPSSVCSGVVCCVLVQLGIKLSKKHVAEACKVSAATLDKMSRTVARFTVACGPS